MPAMSRPDEVLPSLEITTNIGCSLNCRHCPQGLLVQAYRAGAAGAVTQLGFESFLRVLAKLPPGSSLTFAGMSEPFQNPRCADMIRHAHETGHPVSIYTSLVGMTEADFATIRDIPFRLVVLHIPDRDGNARFKVDPAYLAALERGKRLTSQQPMRYSCHGPVHPAVADRVTDHPIDDAMGDRAGNLSGPGVAAPTFLPGPVICANPDATGRLHGIPPNLLPDGRLVACCMDYGMRHVLGNLVTQSVVEIYRGEGYRAFSRGQEDPGCPSLCRTCVAARPKDDPAAIKHLALRAQALRAQAVFDRLEDPAAARELETHPVRPASREVIRRLRSARTVCVFGLGSLFRDSFPDWASMLRAEVLSDNDAARWGQTFFGLPCRPPEALADLEQALIVTYVWDWQDLHGQLRARGFRNLMNIREVFTIPD